jgi:predicted amidohydrolase
MNNMENINLKSNNQAVDNRSMSDHRIRVAAVQMESAAGDKAVNFAKMETFLEKAAQQSVKIIVFPECCITGYWFIRKLKPTDLYNLAEPIPGGETSQRLIALSQKYQMSIGAGLIERAGKDCYYNSYIVAMPNGELRCHRKIQAFEHPLIRSGSEYTVFDTPHGIRIGILICYDNNVNENGRITALMGAEIILAPHQTGGCRTKNPHLMGIIERSLWENRHLNPQAIEQEFSGDKGRGWLMRWLPSRAHDNGVFLVFANGVGVDDDEIRTGNAMNIDPYGRILVETGKTDDDMVVSDLDMTLLDNATGRQWIAARRPEMYGLLTKHTGLERDTHELKFEE